MGILRRGNDAPRVVGFDFGPVTPAAAEPDVEAAEAAEAVAPEALVAAVAAVPEPAFAAPAPVYAAPAYDPPVYAAPAPPPPPDYGMLPAPTPPAPDALDGYLAPATYAAPSADTTHWQQPPPPQWELPKQSRKRGFSVDARAVIPVVIVVSLFAFRGWRVYDRVLGAVGLGRLEVPTTIAGATLLPKDHPLMDNTGSAATGLFDSDLISAAYGINGEPAFAFIAERGDESANRLYSELASSGRQYGLVPGEPTAYGDVTCTTVRGVIGGIVVCFWGTGRTHGMMFHLSAQSMDDAARITKLAYKAVEG